MELKSISATSYSCYETCPHKWSLKYKHDLLVMPNPAFIVGTATHWGLELFHEGKTLPEIFESIKNGCEEDKEKGIKEHKPMLTPGKATSEEIDRFAMVRRMVEAYARNPVVKDTIYTEYEFRFNLPGLKTQVHGFVDRVVVGGLVEYKTSAKDYTLADIDNIQTDIYSCADRIRNGNLPVVTYCILNKTKSKRSDYKPQVLEIKREDSHMDLLLDNLKKFEYNVGNDDFAPSPGVHCRWCDYRNQGCKYGN